MLLRVAYGSYYSTTLFSLAPSPSLACATLIQRLVLTQLRPRMRAFGCARHWRLSETEPCSKQATIGLPYLRAPLR